MPESNFVDAWSKATGAPVRVPAHFVDHPVLGKDLTTEKPSADAAEVVEPAASNDGSGDEVSEPTVATGGPGSGVVSEPAKTTSKPTGGAKRGGPKKTEEAN